MNPSTLPLEVSSPLVANLAFYGLGGVVILAALGVVLHRSIVYSALSLLLCFLAIAGIFVTLNAPFIAAAQILVYAVGLTIVLIFGVMLTGDHAPELLPDAPKQSPLVWWFGAGTALAFGATLLWAIGSAWPIDSAPLFTITPLNVQTLLAMPGAQSVMQDGGLQYIAMLLFGPYSVAFELASVLLLLAMVGAILLSKKSYPEEQANVMASDVELIVSADTERTLDGGTTAAGQTVGASH